MKMRRMAAVQAAVTAFTAVLAMQPLGASAADKAELADYANEVVVLVNEERAMYGLAPVKASTALQEAAQIRAEETVRSFSHTRPDGRASSTVLEDLAIDWRSCGENIAYGYQDAEAVMDGWMHSDGHRANILNQSFAYIGVGVAEKNGVIYCTQVFTGGTEPDGVYQPPQNVTVPETPEPSEDPSLPCIGEACAPASKPDAADKQEICFGGNCVTLPGGQNGSCGDPVSALLRPIGSTCGIAELFGILGRCGK